MKCKVVLSRVIANTKSLSARSEDEHGRGELAGASPSRFLEDRTRYICLINATF